MQITTRESNFVQHVECGSHVEQHELDLAHNGIACRQDCRARQTTSLTSLHVGSLNRSGRRSRFMQTEKLDGLDRDSTTLPHPLKQLSTSEQRHSWKPNIRSGKIFFDIHETRRFSTVFKTAQMSSVQSMIILRSVSIVFFHLRVNTPKCSLTSSFSKNISVTLIANACNIRCPSNSNFLDGLDTAQHRVDILKMFTLLFPPACS